MLGVFITSASCSSQGAFIIHLYLKSYSIPERLFPAQSDDFASAAATRHVVFFPSSVLRSFLCHSESMRIPPEVKVSQQQQTVDFQFGDCKALALFFSICPPLRDVNLFGVLPSYRIYWGLLWRLGPVLAQQHESISFLFFLTDSERMEKMKTKFTNPELFFNWSCFNLDSLQL